MSPMLVAMSLMQVPSGIGSSAVIIAFATCHQKFGSIINRRVFAALGVSSVLSVLLRFGADLREMRTLAYTRQWSDSGASKGGRRTLTQWTNRRSAFFVRI